MKESMLDKFKRIKSNVAKVYASGANTDLPNYKIILSSDIKNTDAEILMLDEFITVGDVIEFDFGSYIPDINSGDIFLMPNGKVWKCISGIDTFDPDGMMLSGGIYECIKIMEINADLSGDSSETFSSKLDRILKNVSKVYAAGVANKERK